MLDVWQADSSGLYDSQYAGSDELHMRGKFRTDADGRYLVRTVRPVHYAIPTDGPVGRMLSATNRHPWRPAHVHFVVSAEGYEPVTTHIFDDTDPYLESDTVFAVKDSLICRFRAARRRETRPRSSFAIDPPFYTGRVRLRPESTAAVGAPEGLPIMTVETAARTRPFTGAEYLESLRDGREIWIYGERVKDVTTHPAFRNTARMIARLYDALHDPATQGRS